MRSVPTIVLVGLVAAQVTLPHFAAPYLALNDVVELALEYLSLDQQISLPGFDVSSDKWFAARLKFDNGSVGSFQSLRRTDDAKLYRGDDGALVLEVSLGFGEMAVKYDFFARLGIFKMEGWISASLSSNSIRARASYVSLNNQNCRVKVESVELVDFGPVTVNSTLRSSPYLEEHLPWHQVEENLQTALKAIAQRALGQLLDYSTLQWTCFEAEMFNLLRFASRHETLSSQKP